MLCRALHETSRSATRYTGALLGIQALGKQAVKASLLGNQASLLRHLAEGKAQQEVLELALVSESGRPLSDRELTTPALL